MTGALPGGRFFIIQSEVFFLTTVHTLASGSSGNAALLSCDGASFLIDAGISCRRITAALKALEPIPGRAGRYSYNPHPFRPYFRYWERFLKKTACPIFATARACRELRYRLTDIDARLYGHQTAPRAFWRR